MFRNHPETMIPLRQKWINLLPYHLSLIFYKHFGYHSPTGSKKFQYDISTDLKYITPFVKFVRWVQ